MSGTSKTSTRSASIFRDVSADGQKKDWAYHLTEHLRLNGVYWGFTALSIMGRPDALDREEMIAYVLRCWDDEAGMWSFCTRRADGRMLWRAPGA